jgi:hypothetical protein
VAPQDIIGELGAQLREKNEALAWLTWNKKMMSTHIDVSL